MSNVTQLVCVNCNTAYEPGGPWTCPVCGLAEGILDVRFNLEWARRTLTRDALAVRPRSHWRYRELLPLPAGFEPIQPDVGWTPMIEAPRLAKALGVARLRLKDDGRNPSGSFKDRPSSLAVAMARGKEDPNVSALKAFIREHIDDTPAALDKLAEWTESVFDQILSKFDKPSKKPTQQDWQDQYRLGPLHEIKERLKRIELSIKTKRQRDGEALVADWRNLSVAERRERISEALAEEMEESRAIACASTGNAASSLACSAAAAGMPCFIFVPGTVPDGKLAQLLAYGATVFKVAEGYAAAYDLCNQACAAFGWYNRNCAINPYLVEGKKTGGLEVAEQCADDPPDWVAASVGDGCSIAGVAKGLREMRAVGMVDWSAKMLGVQAAGCAPVMDVWRRMIGGDAGARLTIDPKVTTYADSINCPVPRNWRKAVLAIQESNGAYVSVADPQIMEAVRLTGALTGVFAEPAAATAVAGVAEAVRQGIIGPKSSVVAIITGNGLKDIAGAMKAVGKAHEISADIEDVKAIVERHGVE